MLVRLETSESHLIPIFEKRGRRKDYSLLIPSQLRVLCRGKYLFSKFLEGSARRVKTFLGEIPGLSRGTGESAVFPQASICNNARLKRASYEMLFPDPGSGSFRALSLRVAMPNYRGVIFRLSIPTGFRRALSLPSSPRLCSSPWRS